MKQQLAAAGIHAWSGISDQLKNAVASEDPGEIVRAFHQAAYGRFHKRAEMLPAVKAYLGHPAPLVRFSAAKALYTAGDRSGFETLIAMVNSNEPIIDRKQDLRIEAARLLAKFREKNAAGDLIQLYRNTSDGRVLVALVTLGTQEIVQDFQKLPFYAEEFAIRYYGALKAQPFLSQIVSAFQQTQDTKVKSAAAWALVRLGEDGYLGYLVQAAERTIGASPKGSIRFDGDAAALKYLGSVQSPAATRVLESALDSGNPLAVRYAVVNLLFNQPEGSEKAKQVVLRELRGEQGKLGVELLLNVATKLDDPEIRAAGEAFDKRSGDGSWKLYSVERRQWPIYNWIDDYVVALKE